MTSASPNPTSATAEIAVLRRIAAALEALDPASRARVVGWLFDRYRRDVRLVSAQPETETT